MKKLIGTVLLGWMAVACAPQGGDMPNCHCAQCKCSAECCKNCGKQCRCDHHGNKDAVAGTQCHKPQ